MPLLLEGKRLMQTQQSEETTRWVETANEQSRLARAMRIEWLGQTTASLLWITGMLVTGLNSTGDYLQIGAASAWLIANIAALLADPPLK